MKRLIFILIPFVCYGQTFKGFQRTQGTTFTFKPNELFESFPNSLSSNPIQNAIPDGWVAWFDPNQNITLNGSTVSQWCDISNTYCLTQGTAANQPTYVSGNRPYMTFNGSTTFLSLSNFGGVGTNPVWSVFIVIKFNNNTGTQTYNSYFTTAQAQGNWAISLITTSLFNSTFMTASNDLNYGVTVTAPTSNLLTGGEFNRTLGRSFAFYNSSYRITNATITTSLTDWSSGTYNVGRDGGAIVSNSRYLNGTIYDIIFYNRSLSASEYNSLYSFFKAKYALP